MDLRLSLLLLGLVVVVLVFTLSRYSNVFEQQLEKLRKLLSDLGADQRRTQTRESRRDPLLDQGEESPASQEELFDFGAEPGAEDVHVEDNELISEAGATQTPDDKEDTLVSLRDDHHELRSSTGPFTSLRQIDYWIKLSPASPVTQEEITRHLAHWHVIQFPVQVHALTQEDPHWLELSQAEPGTRITDVVASYQLLHHGNPANIAELNTFDEQASDLGKALNAEKLMMATPEQALDQSLKLARFYADSCKPLEVSICAPRGQAFMGKLVETSAKQQGLDFLDGEYVRLKRMAAQNVILYRMLNTEAGHFDANLSADAKIRCVTFTMLPALSQTPGRDAKEMLDAVKAFASRVKGEIRVPGEREFHQDMLLKLRNRVSKLEKDTLAAGLEPGGLEISRIFS